MRAFEGRSFCARVRENYLVIFLVWVGRKPKQQAVATTDQTRREVRRAEIQETSCFAGSCVCVCVSVSVCLVGMWSSPRVPVYRHVLSVQHMLHYQKVFETCARERVVWLIACFEALVLPSLSRQEEHLGVCIVMGAIWLRRRYSHKKTV